MTALLIASCLVSFSVLGVDQAVILVSAFNTQNAVEVDRTPVNSIVRIDNFFAFPAEERDQVISDRIGEGGSDLLS